MNERIKQLAVQALKHPDTDNDGLTVFDNDELEKFAKLLIKETLMIAKVGIEYGPSMEQVVHTYFGVEQ